MALIFCPNCGKQVSDTIDRCIHCGELIKEAPPAPKDFSHLFKEQQVALDAEFEGFYVGHSPMKSEKRTKRFSIICAIVVLFLLALQISCFVIEPILKNKFYSSHGIHLEGERDLSQISDSQWKEWREQLDSKKIVVENRDGETIVLSGEDEFQLNLMEWRLIFSLIVILVVMIVTFTVLAFRRRKLTRKHWINCKLFQKWLGEEKGISYQMHLSPKQQKKFDALDVSKVK